ncbi:hypothetical protein PC120_g25833 [Phytophthora cactorum]|nr:hypothetical protein PC120_g25833 [Phytophthora cactorum]
MYVTWLNLDETYSDCSFEGEDAVVSFAIASGLINLHESSEDDGDGERCGAASEQHVGDGVADSRQGEDAGERRGEGDGEERSVDGRQLLKDDIGGQQEGIVGEQQESANDDVVSTSQIDCSVMLSAPTLDAIFEPSDHVGDLSQNAVRRAFDPSSVMDESDHDVVIGTFQRLLSEAESDTHPSVDDVNLLKDGEDAAAYENLDSSGSYGEDELEDEAVVPREYPDDADMSDDEVALVDEAI